MRMELRYKLILAFLVVIAVVLFVPHFFSLIRVSEEWSELGTTSAALAVGLSLGSFFATSITRDVREIRDVANRISEGDLTSEIPSRRKYFEDEFTDLRETFRIMTQRLSLLAKNLKVSSEEVHEAAQILSATAVEMNASTEEIAAAVDGISKGAENQASQVEKMSKTSHQMAASLEAVAEKSKESARAHTDRKFCYQKNVLLFWF